jgi:hypothetical protein
MGIKRRGDSNTNICVKEDKSIITIRGNYLHSIQKKGVREGRRD